MSKFSAYNLIRSFYFAVCGIMRSFWHERNLRIHFFVSGYVLYFSRYFGLSKTEYAVLFIMIGLVITSELINTAIEAVVDLNTPVYSALAKTAKDAAAGGVLVSATASVAVSVVLFWQPPVLLKIWADILNAPFVWLFLLLCTAFLIAWPERRQIANGTGKNNNVKENP